MSTSLPNAATNATRHLPKRPSNLLAPPLSPGGSPPWKICALGSWRPRPTTLLYAARTGSVSGVSCKITTAWVTLLQTLGVAASYSFADLRRCLYPVPAAMLFFAGLLIGGVVGLGGAALISRVSYRKYIELARRAQRNERLVELGTLAGGLAHEIKNPLSTMQLHLQLLLEDIRPDDPLHGRLSTRVNSIQREASRLREIVEDFLRFAGKLDLQRQNVELNLLLEDLVDFLSPQAQLHRVQLRLRRSPHPVHAQIDPRLIKQAVLNLMLNGMQAIDEAGGEMIVQLSSADNHATIEVIDTGKGMSKEVQQKLFQAYFSLRKGGTGLGLAMAKRIIDEHGGTVSVCSEVGKGSNFQVRLPLTLPANQRIS